MNEFSLKFEDIKNNIKFKNLKFLITYISNYKNKILRFIIFVYSYFLIFNPFGSVAYKNSLKFKLNFNQIIILMCEKNNLNSLNLLV